MYMLMFVNVDIFKFQTFDYFLSILPEVAESGNSMQHGYYGYAFPGSARVSTYLRYIYIGMHVYMQYRPL